MEEDLAKWSDERPERERDLEMGDDEMKGAIKDVDDDPDHCAGDEAYMEGEYLEEGYEDEFRQGRGGGRGNFRSVHSLS